MFAVKPVFVLCNLAVSLVAGAPLAQRQSALSPSFATLPKPVLAPYLTYFGNAGAPTLATAAENPGLKAVSLGFITATPGVCAPNADLDAMAADSSKFIAAGGAINLSFGGAISADNPTHAHVQQACKDVPSLTALIKNALLKFNTHNVDFDIEGAVLQDTAATERLAQAVAAVKADIPDLHITYTLATTAQGMTDAQIAQLTAAKTAGVVVDTIALMTMDMNVQDNVAAAQTAITGGAAQVETIYGLAPGEGIKKMGMIPEIGNDDLGVLIDVPGASTLGAFAKTQGLAYVSYWNINRDFPGGTPKTAAVIDSSGAPSQKAAFDFFKALDGAIAGGANAPPAPASTIESLSAPASSSAASSLPGGASVTLLTSAGPAPTSSAVSSLPAGASATLLISAGPVPTAGPSDAPVPGQRQDLPKFQKSVAPGGA